MEQADTIAEIKRAILEGRPYYKGVPLPGPQRTGTHYQRQTYADMESRALYKRHFAKG